MFPHLPGSSEDKLIIVNRKRPNWGHDALQLAMSPNACEKFAQPPRGRRPGEWRRSRSVQPEDTRENQGSLQFGSSRIRRPGTCPGDTRAECGRGGKEERDGHRRGEGDAQAPGVRLRASRLHLGHHVRSGRAVRSRRCPCNRPAGPEHHQEVGHGQACPRRRHPPDAAQLLRSRPRGPRRRHARRRSSSSTCSVRPPATAAASATSPFCPASASRTPSSSGRAPPSSSASRTC